ncbi:MAG: hypothetical protein Q4F67_15920, partial [Propionibacteriaceae bacterium]|nr:hypothetical protein [Propionibacteriaceae bacterium]
VGVAPGVELVIDQPYTLTTAGEEDTGPALPLAALRQNSGEVTVVIEADGVRSEVPVRVIAEGDGWVRIADNTRVAVGTVVVIE